MTGTIGKKLGQFKQWTGERLGTAVRTNAPDDIRRADMETETRKRGVENMAVAVAEYTKTLDKRSTMERQLSALAVLGKVLRQQGSAHDGDSTPYGLALQKIGETEEALNSVQAEFALGARNGLLLELSSLVGSMREYTALKKKLENRRLDYDAKQNKLNASKKEKPRLEAEVTTAQTKYNETLADLQGVMSTFAERELFILEPLVQFARAQQVFFARGAEIMGELAEFLTDERLQQQISENDANPERREMRKALLCAGDAPQSPSESSTGHARGTALGGSSGSGGSGGSSNASGAEDSGRAPGPAPNAAMRGQALSVGGPIAPVAVVPRNVSLSSVGGRSAPETGTEDEKAPQQSALAQAAAARVKERSDTDQKPAAAPPADGCEYVCAIYSFKADGLGEMSLEPGDIVRVLRRIDDGWWVGECPGGRSGMFPANYVEPAGAPAGSSAGKTVASESAGSRAPSAQMAKMTLKKDTNSSSPSKKSKEPEAKVAACGECDCKDFSANVFKAGQCKNCFHRH